MHNMLAVMGWTAFIYAVVSAALAFSLVLTWPRDQSGKLMSFEEASKVFEKLPWPSQRDTEAHVICAFAIVAMLGVALTTPLVNVPPNIARLLLNY